MSPAGLYGQNSPTDQVTDTPCQPRRGSASNGCPTDRPTHGGALPVAAGAAPAAPPATVVAHRHGPARPPDHAPVATAPGHGPARLAHRALHPGIRARGSPLASRQAARHSRAPLREAGRRIGGEDRLATVRLPASGLPARDAAVRGAAGSAPPDRAGRRRPPARWRWPRTAAANRSASGAGGRARCFQGIDRSHSRQGGGLR